MNKHQHIIILLCSAFTLSLQATPATTDGTDNFVTHHTAFWGGAGYSGLVNSFENNKFIGGGGGVLGVGYELRKRRFIFHAGPELRIFSSKDVVNIPTIAISGGTESAQWTKYYKFSDNKLTENHTIGQVMIPIQAGMVYDDWYWLAGVKLGYTFTGTYSQNGSLKTTLTDDWAYDANWENMPKYGLMTNDYTLSGSNSYGFDAAISLEGGITLNKFFSKAWNDSNNKRKYPLYVRAAAFIDIGLSNLSVATADKLAYINSTTLELNTHSLHASNYACENIGKASGKKYLSSLMVGIKITALLQMNKPQPVQPPKPMLLLYTYDLATNNPIGGAQLDITAQKTKRTSHKTTNSKGYISQRLDEDNYVIAARATDYIDSDIRTITHDKDMDTVKFGLRPVPVFKYIVRDAKTNNILSAKVRFIDIDTNKEIATVETDSITEQQTIRLPYGGKYKVHIDVPEHFAMIENIADIGGTKTYKIEPIVKKRAIILHNLFFATNETTILPESEASLQELYELLRDNTEIRIRIIGHTDAIGSEQANQILSDGRANSVRQAMIDRGIAPERIEAEGKGESEPIDTNDTEEGRANNRRVEFVIL